MVASVLQGAPEFSPPGIPDLTRPPLATPEPEATGAPDAEPPQDQPVVATVLGSVLFLVAVLVAVIIAVYIIRALIRLWRDRPAP